MNLNQSLKKTALALALAALCGAASASAEPVLVMANGSVGQSFNLGALADYSLWGLWHSGIHGSVADSITFSLATPASFSFTYGSLYLSSWSDVSSYAIALDDTLLTPAFTAAAAAPAAESFSTELALAAGSHTLSIKNVGALMLGGSYQLQMVTSPVPEPETWALMLGGLGLVGFASRRRKQEGR